MTIRKFADRARRLYITPEDVAAALRSGRTAALVRKEFCQILGGRAYQRPDGSRGPYGVEDAGCCAFVAGRAR